MEKTTMSVQELFAQMGISLPIIEDRNALCGNAWAASIQSHGWQVQ